MNPAIVLMGIGSQAPWLLFQVADDAPGNDFVGLLAEASGPTLMGIIILGALREWWVPGNTHKRTVRERDALLDIVVKAQTAQERAIALAELRGSE